MEMPRSHVRNLGSDASDTIASHCYHVSIIAYCIARMEELDHEQGLRAMSMGTLHDLLEARTGDSDFIAKNYVKVNEEKAIKDQFSNISFGDDLQKLMNEYEKRQSPEARCAKDADMLAQMYVEWTLSWRGNKLAEKWFEGDYVHRVPALKTKSAKKLAMAMKDSNPHE